MVRPDCCVSSTHFIHGQFRFRSSTLREQQGNCEFLPSQKSMKTKRILIVDDEVALTRLMRMSLERTGKFEVRAENDPAVVIAAALEFRPELIVLDLVMPGQDGGDVAEALRKHPELKEIPIVFLTASVRKSEIDAQGGILGGFPFLAKPISADAISKFIDKQLSD